ncbi:hypothetical protein E2C01_090951 [Portunus trituberculatus]|uniref:Uncharacterized protein n=1 Tax=Portunus trituberculatus TaxID=210409 RepID=A0A5B7JN42_PORTR|nr:hypothetical protein [Portunus trituberculatus]
MYTRLSLLASNARSSFVWTASKPSSKVITVVELGDLNRQREGTESWRDSHGGRRCQPRHATHFFTARRTPGIQELAYRRPAPS